MKLKVEKNMLPCVFLCAPIILLYSFVLFLYKKVSGENNNCNEDIVKEYQVPPCQPIRPLDWHEEYNRIMDENHK